MSEFEVRIDRIRGKITGDPIPTLDTGALGVIVVKQTIDYGPVTNTSPHVTSTIPGAPYIPGAQLPNGTRWLVSYSGSMGSDDAGTSGVGAEARVFLLDNHLVADRVWAFAGAKGPYTAGPVPPPPYAARNTNCSGVFIYVANGTHLEFSFESNNGVGGCYFHDFEIIAVPIDSLAATDIAYAHLLDDKSNNALYGGAPVANQPPNIAVNFETLTDSSGGLPLVLSFNAPATDDYVVLGSCVANQTPEVGGAQLEYRLTQTGAGSFGTDWKHFNKDRRDLLPVNLMYMANYSNGQAVTLQLQGKPSAGGISRLAYFPRLMTLRLGAFARKAFTTTPITPVPVTSLYGGSWQTVAELPFTPISDTGEYVLILARMVAWRTDLGAMLGRIRIKETGEIIKDFTPNSNVNGIDYNRSDMLMCAAKLLDTTYTYQLQVSQASGSVGTGFVGQSTLIAIGCTKASGGPNIYSVGIDDNTATTNSDSTLSSTGGAGGNVYGAQMDYVALQTGTSTLTTSVVTQTPATPSLARPRLWLGGGRLAYLRTRTGGAQYAAMLASFNNESYPMNFKYILKWKVTSNAADLTAAKDRYFGPTGMFSQDIVQLLWGSDHTDSGFLYRFVMRDLALALDWFYDDNGVDQLTTNQRDMLRNAILAMTYAKTQTRANAIALDPALGTVGSYLDWANTDTHNNHFYDMMMGATYAGLTLYGESPTTFKYKPGASSGWLSGTTYSFTIPYHIYNGNPANYMEIWPWVKDRTDNMMLPVLDVDSAGGLTEEGTNYGLSAAIYMTEQFALLNTCVGLDYISSHPVFAGHGYYQLYSMQPGATNQLNLGDQPNSPVGRALANDRNRLLALHVCDALPATSLAGYLQYFLNHKVTTMSEGNYEGMDFLLYRHDRTETDVAGLPTHYVASGTGFWNSRDNFSDTGVSVSMSACSHGEEHHHSDFGALQIYRGDSPNPGDNGFLIIDINMKSTIGNNWDLVAHSTDTFATSVTPTGWPQQYFGIPPVPPPPPPGTPNPPTLTSPPDGTTAVAQPFTFAWNASANATSYALQVSLNLNFSALVLDIQNIVVTSYATSGLAAGTVYYWHVLASNASGDSAYSSTFSFTTAGSGGGGGGGVKLVEDTSLLQIFPTNNWWNLDVSGWSPDVNSATIISDLFAYGDTHGDGVSGFHPDWGTVSSTYGIPYIGVDGTQPLVQVSLGAESDAGQPGRPAGYPIPAQAHPFIGSGTNPGWREENGDNHLIVFDRDNMLLYELYQAAWNGNSWSATQGSCFQMNTNNRRPDGWTSADAAGLAIFPGLVKYDDLFSGNPIRHATRFSTSRCPANYYWPASHSGSTDAAPSWPLGMRIRLKASFNIATFVAQFSALSVAKRDALARLLQAFKTYGCIQADRGSHGYFQGTMDARWVDGEYNAAFKALKWTDFEVLTLGRVS